MCSIICPAWSHCDDDFKTFVNANLKTIQDALERTEEPILTEAGRERMKAMVSLPNEGTKEMFMRFAVSLFHEDGEMKQLLDTFTRLCGFEFNLSTAAYRNAGLANRQFASCFLLTLEDDFEQLSKQLVDMKKVMKNGSAVGIGLSKLRAKDSIVEGSSTVACGSVAIANEINAAVMTVLSRDGKHSDAAVYLDVWHSDISDFLTKGVSQLHNIFFGLMIQDEFMKRVEKGENWYLFSPHTVPKLCDKIGTDFSKLYEEAVKAKLYTKCIDAQSLMRNIVETIMATGKLYIIFKDTVNLNSNQQQLGIIYNSNLCAEIMQVTSPDRVAVCTLGTVSLPRVIRDDTFDFAVLEERTKALTKIVDKMVTEQKYALPETLKGSEYRAIGIGASGFADVCFELGIAYDSEEARVLNSNIYETIYHSSLSASCELAKIYGPHINYEQTKLAAGEVQHDLYKLGNKMRSAYSEMLDDESEQPKLRCDWDSLRRDIREYGVRNSLLTTQMPTAGSSIIMNVCESFEPIFSNVTHRKTREKTSIEVNKHLAKYLGREPDAQLITRIGLNGGSVRGIKELKHVAHLFKTVYEIDPKVLVKMSADRQRFIDQSQSFNLYMALTAQNPSARDNPHMKLYTLLRYGWRNGLKTGVYYTRCKSNMSAMNYSGLSDVCSTTCSV